jgi:hypothetical protein
MVACLRIHSLPFQDLDILSKNLFGDPWKRFKLVILVTTRNIPFPAGNETVPQRLKIVELKGNSQQEI